MKLILGIYLLTLTIKFSAYLFTGIYAILADAMHSLVDILLLLILATASKASRKAADRRHPMGHGLIKNVASLAISVAFITVLVFELLKEGINRLLNPIESYSNPEIALYAELLVLFLLLLATAIYLRRKGIVSRTVMFESFNDSLSTLAALLGIIFISMGYTSFDGIATIAIALLIAINSIRLFLENARFLICLSPPEEFYSEVEKFCQREGIKGVHEMVATYIDEGAIHLDMHVTVDGDMSVDRAEKLIEDLANDLRKRFPEIKHVSIHLCSHLGEKRKFY
jgi:ferrous-iron efflux pump FieF